jgi:NTP pyrophosphatase (non-canonical NTP hydrolase)
MTDADATLAQLRQLVREFVAERAWEKFHDPKNLTMSIAIETAELMEHFQWVRSEALPEVLADQKRMSEIRAELADVACYLLALTNVLNVDLAAAVEEKMARNRAKYPAEQYHGRYEKPA